MENALVVQEKALVVQLDKEIINLDSNTGKPTSIERHFVKLTLSAQPTRAYAPSYLQMADSNYKKSADANLIPVKRVDVYV